MVERNTQLDWVEKWYDSSIEANLKMKLIIIITIHESEEIEEEMRELNDPVPLE